MPSAIAGVAMRGAEVVVHGNIGSRAGQVMKAGTLCCGGNASFMAGYMMYGGRLVICGDSGEKVGQDMTGGTIYVGGAIQSLGTDAAVEDIAAAEEEDVLAFLDRWRVPFSGRLQRIVNAGQNLRYPRTEPRTRVIPFFVGSERTDYWNAKVQEDIDVKAQIGRYRIRGYGAARPMPHISDIAFRRDVIGGRARPRRRFARSIYVRRSAAASAPTPLDLSMPVMIAPMSYGALSKSTKLALAIASAPLGICGQHRRGRHDRRSSAAEAKRADLPVPRRPPRLEHPRHAARPTASRSTSARARSRASAAS